MVQEVGHWWCKFLYTCGQRRPLISPWPTEEGITQLHFLLNFKTLVENLIPICGHQAEKLAHYMLPMATEKLCYNIMGYLAHPTYANNRPPPNIIFTQIRQLAHCMWCVLRKGEGFGALIQLKGYLVDTSSLATRALTHHTNRLGCTLNTYTCSFCSINTTAQPSSFGF